jgi:hypothetical protein
MRHCFSSQRAVDELGYQFRPADRAVQDAWDWMREYQYVQPNRQTVTYGKTA